MIHLFTWGLLITAIVLGAWLDVRDGMGFWTHKLPDTISATGPTSSDTGPTPEVQLTLANLVRVGCLANSNILGGGSSQSFIFPTLLGKKLYEACTLQKK